MDNNVKISQLQQLTQMEAPKSQKATDEEFKFTLIRNIDKADLKEKLTGLMKDYIPLTPVIYYFLQNAYPAKLQY